MTVKELITALQNAPQDIDIYLHPTTDDDCYVDDQCYEIRRVTGENIAGECEIHLKKIR